MSRGQLTPEEYDIPSFHVWIWKEAYLHWTNCPHGGLDSACAVCLTIMEVYGGLEWFQRYQKDSTGGSS